MPPFEFYKASGIINENKIFFKDFYQRWYHAGLAGISKDIDSTALYIENAINEIDPEKTYFVGNSMCGYAAILFHALLGKGEREAHDFRELLLKTRSGCKVSIFGARDNALDLIHAEHVKECSGVHIFEFDTGGHALVRDLRNEGKLAQIMAGTFATLG